jgi:hypothetical protein
MALAPRGDARLSVRLPPDHWVWQIKDAGERSAEVKRALDWYGACRRKPCPLAEAAGKLVEVLAGVSLFFEDYASWVRHQAQSGATDNLRARGGLTLKARSQN